MPRINRSILNGTCLLNPRLNSTNYFLLSTYHSLSVQNSFYRNDIIISLYLTQFRRTWSLQLHFSRCDQVSNGSLSNSYLLLAPIIRCPAFSRPLWTVLTDEFYELFSANFSYVVWDAVTVSVMRRTVQLFPFILICYPEHFLGVHVF